jgi:MoaA/NifB/PqqE/SkfB family radical SAM enzyme
MCARNIQGGVENPFMTVTEISLEQFKEWFPINFIKQLDRVYMCGNLGDPIIAKDTLEIFEYIRLANPTITLSMNTNGSARTAKWWEELARLNVAVRFGIDGLARSHVLYRVGTDWQKIIDNAVVFIRAGGHAVWDMLVFDHNKDEVNECRNLANKLGFKSFYSKNTSRFHGDYLSVLDKTGKTTHKLYATDKSKTIAIKVADYASKPSEEKKVIRCKVKEEQSLYISATGNVVPCCWLDMEWMPPHSFSRVDYMDNIGRHLKLTEYTLTEIFDSGIFKEIEQTWSATPLKECSKQCGEVDKFNEQFE